MEQAVTTKALTTLSPIMPDRMVELTNRLRVVRYVPGLGRPLLQLGFIHYARWIVIDSLPSMADGGGWRGLRWKYLLFESNYDGGQDDYLRTFADIVPLRLAKLWGSCFGFEATVERGAGARVLNPVGFREFVERNELSVIDYYAAYPHSTTMEVRQAIGMKAQVAEAARHRDGEDAVLRRMGQIGLMALGPSAGSQTLRARFSSVYDPWRRAVSGRYGVNPLTVATPISVDDVSALRNDCEQSSLLSGLADTETHFARLVIIPPWLNDLGQADPDLLGTAYLLFTSDAWGHAYDQIETLRTKLGSAPERLWGHCPGYPGEDDRVLFHAWIDSHRLPTRYYVAGYPPRTVSEIQTYLAQRARVADTYGAEPRPPASRLLADLGNQRD